MKRNDDPLFRALEECVEFARNYTFELTDDYLALIERVEAMPRNQSGSDKSGRWLGSKDWARLLRSSVESPSKER